MELLSNYLYDKLVGSHECQVTITETSYEIQGDNCKVIISKIAHPHGKPSQKKTVAQWCVAVALQLSPLPVSK